MFRKITNSQKSSSKNEKKKEQERIRKELEWNEEQLKLKLGQLEELVKQQNAEKEEAIRNEEQERDAQMAERAALEVVMIEERDRRKGMIMDKTEQGTEKFDLNMGTMGLVDRLEAHPAGKLLKNVVISNEPPPDRELNIMRLRKFKPQNDFSKMTLSDIPAFRLTGEYMELPITDAMTDSQFASLKQYVLVSDVFIHYIPLDSFFSQTSTVMIQMNDFRKTDNTIMREHPISHSGGYNILMTLDYCVAKEDLHHLCLSISTNLSSFRKGVSWASAKVLLTISHMEFPVKANMQETMGVLHLADSDLNDFISDPRSSDGVITPQAFALLKGHYKRGEIENVNLPRDDTKSVNVAKTVVGQSSEDVNVRSLMSDLRETALKKQRDENIKPPARPSLKQTHFRQPSVSDAGDNDDGDFQNLSEPDAEDSRSDIVSEGTVEIPRNARREPANMRSVNFG